MTTRFGRRTFLRGAAGVALAAGVPMAASCGGDDNDSDTPAGGGDGATSTGGGGGQTSSGGASSGGLPLPTYVPYSGVETDMPATDAGGLAGYLSFPKPPIDAISDTPGSGGSVSVMINTDLATPPPLAKNAYWQNLNEALGVEMKISVVPSGQYDAKLATLFASGDLPDILSMPPTGQPNLSQLLGSEFADLTEYLAGDEVKKYPMLALRPNDMWRSTIFDNKIYGIPTPNAAVTGYLVARQDILAAKGLNGDMSNADDFTTLCENLTDAKKNIYAAGRPVAMFGTYIQEMFGVPNKWRVEDGKFTSQYAVDEYKDALDYTAKLWKQGVFYPDAFSASTQTMIDYWGTGKTALFAWGGTGWGGPLVTYGPKNPDFDLSFMIPPKADGGGAAPKHLGSGVYRMGAIRKGTSKEKILEYLKILNYIAAAFGTDEYLDIYYGRENDDWTWEKVGDDAEAPVRTDRGNSERMQIQYLSGPLFQLFQASYPDITRAAYEFMKTEAENGERLPTIGLHSNTEDTKGASLSKPLSDLTNDIISGRKSVSEWDAAVKTWRSNGGDKIAEEYADALAATGS